MVATDEELVARSMNGDVDSFNQLVLRWERPIYALAYRVIGREEDARDVTQEAFLRAFRALGGFKGQAKVRVRPRQERLIALSVDPAAPRLAPGDELRFGATALWNTGRSGSLLVEWRATGGSITSAGVYTAGQQAGSFQVVGVYGADLADTAFVTIALQAPVLMSLQITPEPVTLPAESSVQFRALGTWSDNSSSTPVVAWSATGGTITNTGFYTAGSVAGSYRVIATSQDGTKADTASITISPSGPWRAMKRPRAGPPGRSSRRRRRTT